MLVPEAALLSCCRSLAELYHNYRHDPVMQNCQLTLAELKPDRGHMAPTVIML